MWKNPFILKSLHVALLGVKDERIKGLCDELERARTDKATAEAARDAAVQQTIEAMTPKPAVLPQPRTIVPREPAANKPKTLNLADVDPNDKVAIRDIAFSEMPAGKQSGTMLLQKMESIKAQAIIAQAARRERSKEVGVLSAPEVVMAKIEAAELEGKERARVN